MSVFMGCRAKPGNDEWGIGSFGAGAGVAVREHYTFIAVYILASRRHGTLYVGVTSDLNVRGQQHRKGSFPGFTNTYGVKRLV